MKKVSIFFLIAFCLNTISLFAQINYFENIAITPASCGDDNGVIRMEAPFYIDVEWEDDITATEVNRDNLAPGVYTVSGTDERGCVETLVLEVPDLGECDFELTYYYPSPPSPRRPCVIVGFNFTLNGNVVPNEDLDILWTVTVPGVFSYQSNQPTVPVYVSGTILTVSVSLNSEEEIPCCSFNETTQIIAPCGVIKEPKVYVHKSIFTDDQNQSHVPGRVELLVYGNGICGETTDLRGYIVDDNNGELIYSADSTLTDGNALNVTPGYLLFSDDPNWATVRNGSLITIYESGHGMNSEMQPLDDPTDANGDFHYVLSAENSSYFRGVTSSWSFDNQMNTYSGTMMAPSWDLIRPDGIAGAMQVRYPDGSYCHGFSFGKTSVSIEENLFPLHISDTQHSYCQIHMNELSYLDKSAFDVYEITGGFTPGVTASQSMSGTIGTLRDCLNLGGNGQALNSPPGSNVSSISNTNMTTSDEIQTGSSKAEAKGGAETKLELSPNPFHQFLTINYQSASSGKGHIRIYDSLGKLMQSFNLECKKEIQSLKVDFGKWHSSGLFLIEYQTPDGQTLSEKAILVSGN